MKPFADTYCLAFEVQLRGLLHLSSSFFVCNLIYAGLDDT
jgi:hypothetical protein